MTQIEAENPENEDTALRGALADFWSTIVAVSSFALGLLWARIAYWPPDVSDGQPIENVIEKTVRRVVILHIVVERAETYRRGTTHCASPSSARRTPRQSLAGCGARQRKWPVGGAAKGIPLKTATDSLRLPCKVPLAVSMVCGCASAVKLKLQSKIVRRVFISLVLC